MPSPVSPLRWEVGAACAGSPLDLWFDGNPAAAKKICSGCPALAECLAYALSEPVWGVWGGTTEKERRRINGAPTRRVRHVPGACHAYYDSGTGGRCSTCWMGKKNAMHGGK
jgi:WhiB family redox-sensing transcriptional regulator